MLKVKISSSTPLKIVFMIDFCNKIRNPVANYAFLGISSEKTSVCITSPTAPPNIFHTQIGTSFPGTWIVCTLAVIYLAMLIGYDISGYSNDSYMTGSCDKLFSDLKFLPKCHKCGYRTDFRYTNKDFRLKRKTLDFSATYDGITIVSLKFKEFCLRNRYDNLIFIDLPKTPDFYHFYINNNIIKYGADMKDKLCETCGQYESVIGPTLKAEAITEGLKEGFYQSDLWFGSGNEKSPKFIISPETKQRLEKDKFKNICFTALET